MPQSQENNLVTVKVEVFLDSSCCSHPCAHVEAVISFLDLQFPAREFIYMSWKNSTRAINPSAQRDPSIGREIAKTVLYNKISYDQCAQFLQTYKEKFGDIGGYNLCCQNCADATSFILDYFFPDTDASSIKIRYQFFQLLVGIPFLLTCGLLPRCCPGIPCMNLPADIFRRAELLSCIYGNQPDSINEPTNTFSNTLFTQSRVACASNAGATFQSVENTVSDICKPSSQ